MTITPPLAVPQHEREGCIPFVIVEFQQVLAHRILSSSLDGPKSAKYEKQANQATERGLLCFSGISRVHHERPGKESWSERDKATLNRHRPWHV